ncbi:MAG: response regulator transcription factor [Lachnospiraceae bacterium]|nr:response regulator transcription factor [Lachnospiraceae bacterium]
MVRVLIVEDEASVRLYLKARLKDRFEIHEAADGQAALDFLDKEAVDLLIVDISMPRMDGYEFVKSLRDVGDMTPVIMLTAMDTFDHKKKGFALGIDDYLTKPIDHEELIWHMEAILRRARISSDKVIEIGDFSLSEETRCAIYGGKKVELTEKEFQLLHKLLSYPGQLFTKQNIMDDIWGYDTESDYNTIKTYISRLRNKFSDCDAFSITSLRGLGYKAEIRR